MVRFHLGAPPSPVSRAQKIPRFSVDISEEAGVRQLHFGTPWVQGAMRIARPWSLELEYTRDMTAGLLFRPSRNWPRRILLIGLGAGSLAKFFYRYLPDCRITVVEINPQVEFVARQYFRLPDDPRRLDIVIGCGADYMLSGNTAFDYILCDGFDPDARAGALDTEAFYQACRARLHNNGLLCTNLLNHDQRLPLSKARLNAAFDNRTAIFGACPGGNTVAFARGDEPVDVTLDEMRERASALKTASRLDLGPTIARMQLGLPMPDASLHF